MITVAFFDKVLAHQGLRCIGYPVTVTDDDGKVRHPIKHHFFNTNEELAAAALRLDARDKSVYHACSTFISKDVKKPRSQDNAGWMRSFWADVDVGETKAYATKRAAIQALQVMLRTVGLPTPMLVGSGGGLHLYWPLDADVTRDQWGPVASLLKAVLAHVGFQADPTRTADAASILRPVGTHHRKGAPIPVALLRDAPETTLATFHGALQAYVDQHGLTPPKVSTRRGAVPEGPWSELASAPSYAASDFKKVAKGCQQVTAVVASKGDCSYETWRLTIGLLKVTVEDEAKARRLAEAITANRGATGHTNTDWQTRFDTWGSGPPTCEKFREANPAGCVGCPHSVTSPIRLGEATIDSVPVVVQNTTASAAAPIAAAVNIKFDTSTTKLSMPYGWLKGEIPHRSANGLLQTVWKRDSPEEAPTSENVPFCATVFYPVQRLEGSDDGAGMTLEMWVRVDDDGKPTETRRFTLSNAAISDTSQLLRELARHEIVPLSPHQGNTMKAYLNSWIDDLRQRAASVRQLNHFGWNGDDFLVGNTLLRPDGTAQTVTLRGIAEEASKGMAPRGSLDEWKRIIHTAYNHPGQEHYQFIVSLGFAAPLFSLFGEFGGATAFAHSTHTGRGKTTAQRAALSVWGSWEELMLSEGKATSNYLWRHIGTMHNLPLAYDELTNLSHQAASELVFSISAGAQRRRCRQDGSPQERGANWQTLMLASGNTSLMEKLALHRADASAEMARVFEFSVPEGSPLSVTDANNLFPLLIDNYGWAGLKFAAYIVQHKAAVKAALTNVRDKITADCNITQSERYWAAVMASSLTALHICRKLGLLEFPMAGLKQWLYQQVNDNRGQLAANVATENEVFGEMMRDLWSGMLVTDREGDLRKAHGDAMVLNGGPRGSLIGRYIVGSVDASGVVQTPSSIEVSVLAMKEWANKKGVSASEIHRNLVAAGFAAPKNAPVLLGRGTRGYSATPQVRCMTVYPDAWNANTSPLGNNLRVIVGGLLTQQPGTP